MREPDRYIHRVLTDNPSEYERDLAFTLLKILGKSIHDAPGIAAELNKTSCRHPTEGSWTEQNFIAEMERLGSYHNAQGAPLGSHPSVLIPPGSSSRVRKNFATMRSPTDEQ